jgi:beta-lactamase regulating signal transducer with metallopeptidase domain
VECIPLLLASNAACAAGLAVVVAALVVIVRRPAFANRAWLVVLLKLVAPPLVAVPVVWHTAAHEAANVPQTEEYSPAIVAPPIELPDVEAIEPDPATAALPDAAAVVVVPPEPPADAPNDAAEAVPVRRWLGFAWLAGALGYWSLVAVRVVRFRRVLRDAEPVPGDVLPAMLAAQVGLRRWPAVAFVPWDVSPMVWAVFGRPRVLLPRRLWAALSPEQREAVLAHELAHLARGDHWVRRLELLVLGAYWWFPVAWLAVRELRRAEEACCDAWAVCAAPGRAGAYAEALVEAVAFVSRPGRVPLASGGAARLSQLKRRLTMILRNPPSPRLRWPAALAVAALAVAALPWSPTLADDKPRVADEPRDPPRRPPDPRPGRVAIWEVASPPNRENANQLKDELELLVAQRETKQAMVRVAEADLKIATIKLSNTARLAQQNVVSQQEVNLVRNAAASAEAQLAVRKGELKEQDVKIAQAKRRLEHATAARLAPPTETRQLRPDLPSVGRRKGGRNSVPSVGGPQPRPSESLGDELKRLQAGLATITAHQAQLKEQFQQVKAHMEHLKVAEVALSEQATKLRAAQQKVIDALKAKEPDSRKP